MGFFKCWNQVVCCYGFLIWYVVMFFFFNVESKWYFDLMWLRITEVIGYLRVSLYRDMTQKIKFYLFSLLSFSSFCGQNSIKISLLILPFCYGFFFKVSSNFFSNGETMWYIWWVVIIRDGMWYELLSYEMVCCLSFYVVMVVSKC